eukprot:351254-Chlamydomonas_euryale.AAC.2
MHDLTGCTAMLQPNSETPLGQQLLCRKDTAVSTAWGGRDGRVGTGSVNVAKTAIKATALLLCRPVPPTLSAAYRKRHARSVECACVCCGSRTPYLRSGTLVTGASMHCSLQCCAGRCAAAD